MVQTDLALGGAAGTDGSTPPRLVWIGSGARGVRRTAVVAALVLAVGGGFAWFGWHSTERTATPQRASSTSVVVTGDVVVEGVVVGGGVQAPRSVIPIRSAPMLVPGFTASGRRVARRLEVDRHGHFRLKLVPGRYTFTVVIYQGSTSLAHEPHATVRVRSGHPARVRITQHVF